jgi:hypothetical protein
MNYNYLSKEKHENKHEINILRDIFIKDIFGLNFNPTHTEAIFFKDIKTNRDILHL